MPLQKVWLVPMPWARHGALAGLEGMGRLRDLAGLDLLQVLLLLLLALSRMGSWRRRVELLETRMDKDSRHGREA